MSRTKYDPETIAKKSRGLDWDNRCQFKEYKVALPLTDPIKKGQAFAQINQQGAVVAAVVAAAVLQLWSTCC